MSGFAITPLGKEVPPTPEVPKIYSENFKHSIVSSSHQPELSLLSMAPGSARMGRYYRIRKARDEESAMFSPGNLATYQSYISIDKAIIKQEGNGAFNFDPQTAEATKVFNGWSILDLTPGKNDVVVFDIGGGYAGLFGVTEQPEIREITTGKLYYLTYQFLCVVTKEINDILEDRVVSRQVYSRDAAMHSRTPVISPEEYGYDQKLFGWKGTIASYLLREFYWNPERTIVFTASNDGKVYDPYLVNFIKALMPPDMLTTYPFIQEFSVQYGGLEKGSAGTINIWEVLLRGDWNLLPICNNKAAIINVRRLPNTRLYGNISSSKIEWFIATNPEDFREYRQYFNMDGYPVLLPSKSVNFGGYVFSDEFFTGDPVDEFEKIVIEMLRDRVANKQRLLKYCEGYFALDTKKQLYHGAILLLLLEVSRKLGDPL